MMTIICRRSRRGRGGEELQPNFEDGTRRNSGAVSQHLTEQGPQLNPTLEGRPYDDMG